MNSWLIAVAIGCATVRGQDEVYLGHVELVIRCSVCFDTSGATTVTSTVVATSVPCSLDTLGCFLLLHQAIVKILGLRCVLIFGPCSL